MPRVRRRKLPVTADPDTSALSRNSTSSRTLIRRFHVLLKKEAHLTAREASAERTRALADVTHEMDKLGGLPVYQQMSSIGQGKDRGGGSEKVLISWLKELRTPDGKGKRKHKLLEVGALKPDNYQSCSVWIDALPIDLRSRHPSITEQDFLLMDQHEHGGKWDVISLSLVLNFVPDVRDRGRMLTLANHMLCESGLLFLVLPLPCVTNSRYLTLEHLENLMEAIGFDKIRERWNETGKMAYWLFSKRHACQRSGAGRSGSDLGFDKKAVLREGNRNNFCILL